MESIISGYELEFLISLLLSLFCGVLIGIERETRGKSAGISTHCFVVGGSMLFTLISAYVDPASKSRIAAQIITGVGFLGAGIIMKNDSGKVTNLTTAASIWFAASIGMAIGYGWYFVAVMATIYALIIPRLPQFPALKKKGSKK